MGKICVRAAAVLQFIDAVTEKRVAKSEIKIQAAQQNKILWKDTGCAVVLAQSGVCYADILVSGEHYRTAELHLVFRTDGKPLIKYIWLHPSAQYPFAENMTVIRGRCLDRERNRAVYAVRQDDAAKYRLAESVASGDRHIRLWRFDRIAGERIILLDENGEREWAALLGHAPDSEDCYYTKDCIKKAFHKSRTKVYIAAEILPDKDGSFLYAYQHTESSGGKIQFWCGDAIAAELNIGRDREYIVEL